mgnify:CR=1 FL=1|jgi:uncharacterized membrane protein YhaH (DUF805 family)
MDWIRSLFSFEGRYNRARFLLAVLITFGWHIYWAIAGVIVGEMFGLSSNPIAAAILPIPFTFAFEGGQAALMSALFMLIATLPINIVPLWVAAASWAKRLHDRNKSGWWAVPLCGLPYLYIHLILICAQLKIAVAAPTLLAILAVPVSLLSAWALIELYFMPGTEGRNRFGADPLSPIDRDAPLLPHPMAQTAPAFLLRAAPPIRTRP